MGQCAYEWLDCIRFSEILIKVRNYTCPFHKCSVSPQILLLHALGQTESQDSGFFIFNFGMPLKLILHASKSIFQWVPTPMHRPYSESFINLKMIF